jgi:hypothetical protein
LKKVSGEALLLAGLIAVHLVPLWVLPYFPSQDGPAHLALANILREYGGPGGQVLREYFVRDPGAVTNWFVYFVLAYGLGFLPVAVAEKVFLSAYVVLFPVAARYAVRGVEPRNAFLALLAVPFTYSYLLAMGFYNFCFSLVAFLFALGYWLRHGERLGWRDGIAFALLALWVYVCHVLSFGMLVAAVGTLGAWEVFSRGWSQARRLGGTALALLPGVLLMISFMTGSGLGTTSLPVRYKLLQLVTLDSLVSFDPRTRFFGYAAAALLAALSVWALSRRPMRGKGWLAVVAVFLALVLAMPTNLGVGGFISWRLSLFTVLALILWLAHFDPPAPVRRWVAILSVSLALGLLGLLWTRWWAVDDYMAEYLSAGERIPEGSTLLHLSYAHQGRWPDGHPIAFRVEPFLHAGSRIPAGRTVADLWLYAADFPGYFPLHYRPERNPYDHIGVGPSPEEAPPRVEFLTYPERTGGRVDFVLLWQVHWEWRHPAVQAVRRQLEAGYERVWVSPRGLAELWRVKGFSIKR